MSKVIVTGANGFVGSWLTQTLIEAGHEVRVLVRPSSDLTELKGLNIFPWTGDVTDLASLKRAFQGCDTIFHLAGLIAYKKADRLKMELVNVTGTKNVITACQQANVRKLVYLSSVVAVGASKTPNQVLNESSPYTIGHLNLGYFETKRLAENVVINACKEKRVDAVILNPSTIYGPGDAKKGSRKTQVKVAQGKFPFYTSGGVSVVDIEDVVNAIMSAWEKGRTGERYILSGENVSIQKLFSMIAEAAGAKPPHIYLPNWLVHLAGMTGDFKATVFGSKSSLSRENAWTSTMYHWFDSSKAQKELGFKSRPATESIQKSVQWMKENAYIL